LLKCECVSIKEGELIRVVADLEEERTLKKITTIKNLMSNIREYYI